LDDIEKIPRRVKDMLSGVGHQVPFLFIEEGPEEMGQASLCQCGFPSPAHPGLSTSPLLQSVISAKLTCSLPQPLSAIFYAG
jgi:hypothetical protein